MSHICGCYVYSSHHGRSYLPQIKLDAHTTILSTASRTVLTQTFMNDSNESLQEIKYSFPLYDGVSIVDFFCQIGERTIYGLVKEKNEARKTYKEAKDRGENAALLEQLPDAADVFTTTISNIPKDASVQVTVKYVQELKHDAEVDGVRLNIPTHIAPRYGDYPGSLKTAPEAINSRGMTITVDIDMVEGAPIKKIISPSHPIQVTLGSLSTSTSDEEQSLTRGSATLALDTVELKQDFVLQVVAKDVGAPQATLETHPTLPNQRALMATLVPRFNLKSERPEIILIADRSGSMEGSSMVTLKAALKVFLKSIPLGCTFNICSFGSGHRFLWDKSKLYDEDTLTEALKHVDTFQADFGGTETLAAVRGCFKHRSTDSPTELILLTDGDIWQQEEFFNYVRQETKAGDVRVFPLGIGSGVSSSLIEGVARAGGGFAQMVATNEKMDVKIVRMLKGALTPHINDYRLEVKYEDDSVDTVADSLRVRLNIGDADSTNDKAQTQTQPISLYDADAKEEHPKEDEIEDIFAGLPDLKRPTLLQTPHKIPALFPFNRTCVYLLMAPESSHLQPKSVVLKATSPQGPLELEIPVKPRKDADEMIHQLAARKATKELEEDQGWLSDAILDDTGELLKKKQGSMYARLARREAVRLGVEFQVGGKYCSFVAVEANEAEILNKRQKALEAMTNRKIDGKDEDKEDWEMLETRNYTPCPTFSPQVLTFPSPAPERSSQGYRRYMGANNIIATGYGSAGTSRRVRGVGRARGRGGNRGGDMSTFGARLKVGLKSQSVTKPAPLPPPPHTEESDDSDDDMGFGLFDDDEDACFAAPPPARKKASRNMFIDVEAEIDDAEYSREEEKEEEESDEESEEEENSPVPTSTSLLHHLISLQTFSGPWPSLATLPLSNLRVSPSSAQTASESLLANGIAPDAGSAEKLLATALVVVFLQKKMPDEEDTWELVVEKANAWLEGIVEDEAKREVWKVARELVDAEVGFEELAPASQAKKPRKKMKYGLFD
ncbi:hypothetical protein yc1106_06871 [Curvularia clavata]|uniref:Uncharacterized protein n=1 Tax=Curvularia clavata TaxID=95742 RepID=A0A9Q9DU97_CURCL|nr:hypothetical protein yc1106_06871 [Curvularia clavata]